MAYVAPTSRATGFLVTSAVWNQDVVDNVAFLANPPACRVRRAATQSIATATNVALAWDTEDTDPSAMHDPVSNPSRVTINTAGLYVVNAITHIITGVGTVDGNNQLLLNGATQIMPLANSELAGEDFYFGTDIRRYVAGDYIEAIVRYTAGANQDAVGTMSVVLLGI